MESENNNQCSYESSTFFLNICKELYNNEMARITRLQNRASILITIILAISAFIPSNFNINSLLNANIETGADIIKIISIVIIFVCGIILIIASILGLYGVIKPHNYRTIDINKLYEKNIYDQDLKVAEMFLATELFECINYNKPGLNKQFSKYNSIWHKLSVGIVCIVVSCLLSNLLF